VSAAIYLDAHATTAVDPSVLDAMLPWFRVAANSHSDHALGRGASAAVERARGQVASLIGADADEVVFTPGASLAANIALRSLVSHGGTAARSAIEHPCVTETLAELAPTVATVELPVGVDGLVELDDVADVLDQGASLVAVMAVNNEVGTIQPIGGIGQLCEYAGASFFTDLAQAVGRVPIDVHKSRVTAGAVSSHKLYGPQGIGALFCRRDMAQAMRPVATGGGQERGISPGTLPTPLCVGFGAACEIAEGIMAAEAERISRLRDRLLGLLRDGIHGLEVNGSLERRVANNLNVSFPGVDADELLASMPGLIASTGSACSSGAIAPSHVLTAMGLSAERVAGAVRFGLGRTTTPDEIDRAAALVIGAHIALTTGKRT
jgi:cysteine desulfurase